MSGGMSRMMKQMSESNDARDAAWIGSYRLAIMGEATVFDEDADVRSHLAPLGPAALAERRRILEGPPTDRTEILRALTGRPASADLATLIAMADTDEVVRLRLLMGDPGHPDLGRPCCVEPGAKSRSGPAGSSGPLYRPLRDVLEHRQQ